MKISINCGTEILDLDGNTIWGSKPGDPATVGFLLAECLMSDKPCPRWNALERMGIARKVRSGGEKNFNPEAIVAMKELANAVYGERPMLLAQILETLGETPTSTDVE